jgi:hypothetical protein
MSKLRLASILVLALSLAFISCKRSADPLAHIKVIDNPWLKVSAGPNLLAEHLNNPMAPRFVGGKLIFAESGTGNVSEVENGRAKPLITGFVKEQYDGFEISAEGITIDPASGLWIIALAQGPGRVQIFDPATFPTEATKGRDVRIEGATDDNPFATVLAAGGRILVVSGGTKTAYQGKFEPAGDSNSVRPVFQVKTGLIGLAVDPKSGDVFGAVFGDAPGSGEIIRWDSTREPVSTRTVARGLTRAVALVFTNDGVLLASEFGDYGGTGQGKVSIVATDGSGSVTPFITGLNNPSGLSLGLENTLYIAELGESINSNAGTLISLKFVPTGKR